MRHLNRLKLVTTGMGGADSRIGELKLYKQVDHRHFQCLTRVYLYWKMASTQTHLLLLRSGNIPFILLNNSSGDIVVALQHSYKVFVDFKAKLFRFIWNHIRDRDRNSVDDDTTANIFATQNEIFSMALFTMWHFTLAFLGDNFFHAVDAVAGNRRLDVAFIHRVFFNVIKLQWQNIIKNYRGKIKLLDFSKFQNIVNKPKLLKENNFHVINAIKIN